LTKSWGNIPSLSSTLPSIQSPSTLLMRIINSPVYNKKTNIVPKKRSILIVYKTIHQVRLLLHETSTPVKNVNIFINAWISYDILMELTRNFHKIQPLTHLLSFYFNNPKVVTLQTSQI
jgi:hypothetical protein